MVDWWYSSPHKDCPPPYATKHRPIFFGISFSEKCFTPQDQSKCSETFSHKYDCFSPTPLHLHHMWTKLAVTSDNWIDPLKWLPILHAYYLIHYLTPKMGAAIFRPDHLIPGGLPCKPRLPLGKGRRSTSTMFLSSRWGRVGSSRPKVGGWCSIKD